MTDLHSVSITKSFALNELVMREAANLEVVVVAIGKMPSTPPKCRTVFLLSGRNRDQDYSY